MKPAAVVGGVLVAVFAVVLFLPRQKPHAPSGTPYASTRVNTPATAETARVPEKNGSAREWRGVRPAASTIRGRIVSRYDRQALKDIPVVAQSEHGAIAASAVTLPDGTFELPELSSRSYQLRCEPPPPWLPQQITVRAKDEGSADVGDIALRRRGVLYGRVINVSDRTGIPGETVELQNVANNNWPTARTNSNGEFLFSDLHLPEYAVVVKDRQHLYMGVTMDEFRSAEIELPIGNSRFVGRVFREGAPYGSASIRATRRNDPGEFARITRTDEQGHFEMNELPPGTWHAEVFPFARRLHGHRMEFDFQTTQASVIQESVDLPSGTLVGQVVDSSGNPVQQATVRAIQGSRDGGGPYLPDRDAVTTSGTDGWFLFEGLSPESYSVVAQKTGAGASNAQIVDVPFSGASTSATLALRSPAGATLISVALDYTSGTPVREAWCRVTGDAGPVAYSASRDDNGVLLISNLPPGDYQVEVSSHGYSIGMRNITVVGEETITLHDVLHEAGAVQWRLEYQHGSAVTDAKCTLSPNNPESLETAHEGKTDTNGIWEVRGLWPGSYTLTAFNSHTTVTEHITIHAHNLSNVLTALPSR